MPIWNPQRSPELVPMNFHNPFLRGPGKHLLCITESEADAKRESRRFASFKASLKTYPLHPTAIAARDLKARLSAEREAGRISLWVNVERTDRLAKVLMEAVYTS